MIDRHGAASFLRCDAAPSRATMHAARIPVEVVMERVPLRNRWVSERWQPVSVTPARAPEPGEAACVRLPAAEGHARWCVRGHTVELHPTEAEGYFLNLTAPEPKAFVMWRMYEDGEPPARPVVVTLSYNEAARSLDAGEQVDGVPLVPALADWMRPFIATHYRPEPRRKVRRNDPFAGDSGRRS
jgi:hypothetical protein